MKLLRTLRPQCSNSFVKRTKPLKAANTMKVFSGRYHVNQTAQIRAHRGFAVELNRGFLGRLPTFARSGYCGDSAGDFPEVFIKTKNAFKKNPLEIRWKIREMSEPHGRTKSADAQETRIRRRHHPKENPRFPCTRCARAPSLAAASPLLVHSTEIILAAAVRSCFSLGHGSCIVQQYQTASAKGRDYHSERAQTMIVVQNNLLYAAKNENTKISEKSAVQVFSPNKPKTLIPKP